MRVGRNSTLAAWRLPVLAALAGCFFLAGARADERILSYHSEIEIHADGAMTVAETIRVRSEGRQIRRGIYRDFPTRYRDGFGNAYAVAFQVLGVTREGRPEPWHQEARSNGVRLYVGSADVLLPPGEHTFVLTYRTNRSVGYFADHDELYWNVTGTGWAFPMDRVSARVVLPAPVPASALGMEGYTGSFGATQRAFAASMEDGAASIEATRPLGPGEGLTLAMSWPKGVVREPTATDRIGWLLTDNLGLLLALAVFLGAGGFLLFAWHHHGRDPAAGVVFARYQPPEDFSAGSMRYIRRMGYDADTLTAAVVSLAVKGYLTIRNDDGDYVLEQRSSEEPLGPGEAALHDALFADGPEVVLDDENHQLIGNARSAHKKALKRNYYRIYFKNNAQWLIPTFAGTLLAFVAVAFAGLLTPAVVLVFVLNLGMQALFLYLMKSPTRQGRELLDELDGFRLYLSVAEKEDLEARHPPRLTPDLFERYLPFAIALGVANEWAERFATVLSRMSREERAAYSPVWYRGAFDPHGLNRFVADVGSGFSSAIASAATPPGSSSGSGGGGFSGGGGGGGGGGGW